jgi:hypothetical protein
MFEFENGQGVYKMILKNGDSRTIHSKRWILLTIKNFKESIMMNNNKAKKVWKYYFHLRRVGRQI